MAVTEKKEKKTKRPTALKRDLQNVKRRTVNRQFKSTVRTAVRAFDDSEKAKDVSGVQEALKSVYSLMDKGVKRGVYARNKSSRTKARFFARAAAVQA